jgi:hypothetical protein
MDRSDRPIVGVPAALLNLGYTIVIGAGLGILAGVVTALLMFR